MKLKTRMNLWFSGTIFLVVMGMSVLLIAGIYKYYYDNLKSTLMQQSENARASIVAELALWPSDQWYDVAQNYEKLYMQLIQFSPAEFVLLDPNGYAINESGLMAEEPTRGIEVDTFSSGESQMWRGQINGGGPEALAVFIPLTKDGNLYGFASYITSLEPLKAVVSRISAFVLLVASGILMVSFIFINIIAGRIVKPIKDLEQTTLKMIAGEAGTRAPKMHADEVGQLADGFNQMLVDLEAKEKVKNLFIASVSHELRTPLTSILGWAVTLKHDKTNPETLTTGLDIIVDECNRLAGLVDNLLDFSKLESGSVELFLSHVDLRLVLKKVYNQMAPSLENACIEWVLFHPELPVFVNVDVNQIKQLLINLIDNAVKFSEPSSQITLSLGLHDGMAHVEVCDRGCGIPSEQLSKIFDKFYKGNAKKRGSGIGLSVCKAIADLHGGRIEAESTEGVGSTFRLILPVTLS